jgi:hypothetical protein
MATTDTLNVKLTADTGGYAAAMKQAEKSTKDFSDTAKNSKKNVDDFGETVEDTSEYVEEFGDKAQKAGKKAETAFSDLKKTIISLGIGQLIKTSITDAMNAFESESLFETSMGAWAEQARAWSEQLSANLGLDPYALRSSVSFLFTMTQTMGLTEQQAYSMSTSLVELAGDMASFYNMSFDEAFSKLRSGIAGETEPLRALGIVLSAAKVEQEAYRLGIAKTGEQLDEQQKALASYSLIIQQTGTAQGDLTRTIDSPANQLRVTMNELKLASIEFGAALMPIVSATLPILRDVIEEVKPVITDVAKGVSYLSAGLQLFENPAMRAIGYTVAIAVAMNKLKLAVGGPLSAIILLGTALSWFVGKFGEAERTTGEDIADIAEASTAATDAAKTGAEELGEEYKKTGDKIKGMLAGFDEITKLSGSSSTNLVTDADVRNSEEVNKNVEKTGDFLSDLENQFNDIFGKEYTVNASMAEIGIPEIDWDVIMTNFSAWVERQDWNKAWQDVGTAFQDVFKVALGIIDGLFGTKLNEWYDKVSTQFFEYGFELEKAVNPADEGLQALERYKQEHGTSAWQDFYNKVTKEGISPTQAYKSVYSDINLQKGFAAYGADLAAAYITEFEGMSTEEVLRYLTPSTERRAGDIISQNYLVENPNLVGLFEAAVYDNYQNKLDDPNSWASAVNSLNASKRNPLRSSTIDNMRSSETVTASDIYSIIQNAPGSGITRPIQIHNTVELDGEPIKSWTKNWQDEDVGITNGRQ